MTIFMDGFYQGVNYYNEQNDTDVQVVGWDGETGSFTGGFEAGPEAKTVAQNIIDQGVDVLLPVGSRSTSRVCRPSRSPAVTSH